VIRTGVFLCVNTEAGTAVKSFYWNIRTVSNKQTELFDNVCYVEFQIVCLNKTCIKYICFYHKLFPHFSLPSILTLSVVRNIVLLF